MKNVRDTVKIRYVWPSQSPAPMFIDNDGKLLGISVPSKDSAGKATNVKLTVAENNDGEWRAIPPDQWVGALRRVSGEKSAVYARAAKRRFWDL